MSFRLSSSTPESEGGEDSRPRTNACIVITGDALDPEACTRFLGVIPTEIGVKGTSRPDRRPPVPETFWSLDQRGLRLYSTDEVVALVLQPIWPVRDQLRQFVAEHDLKVTVVVNVTINEERPVYELSTETMRKLVEIGAEFALDIFDYS